MSASALAEESTLIKTPPKRISPAWLFVVVIGFPVLAIVACFPLLSSSFFQKYGDLPNERRLGVVFQARDQKCDILLYGDSTAQVGLDPELITKATHLTTCNIAVTEPAIELLGTEPLDRFLSVNPRPHYLVFSFQRQTSPLQTHATRFHLTELC